MKTLSIIAVLSLLGGCMTQIHAPEGEVQPTGESLGAYSKVFLAPLRVEQLGTGPGDIGAVADVEAELLACMKTVFPGLRANGDMPKGLLMEPVITDIKKVTAYERVLFGFMPGSSAVLMKVRFTDTANRRVIAEPVFYARGFAMSGAATFGITDDMMLDRIADKACDYAKSNL
ncbi:hypothetical protein CU669_17700 [Paramagnetospirillum kuznetsovii]|uniref:DUF4410 domain-containing protein n=1 Tax=Paramagnetospirillum kuznetsovii TaxID=2053833 RepID=A0A364NU29_9PROT|nr:hypothetical protein [Paramagnetospirillum kuznetsovii]RAU20576.1 hypothetical protein CU669_17700 [Paramagnetospirillum kuznetsovii]